MTINVFGVTPSLVRDHYFPHLDAFSVSSSPSDATVTARIQRAAARLSSQLLLRNIDIASITDVNSSAYLWCAETISLITAIRLAEVMSGVSGELVKSWKVDLAERINALANSGVDALGGGATAFGTTESAGPTDFIGNLGLEYDDGSDSSSTVPRLRRSDEL